MQSQKKTYSNIFQGTHHSKMLSLSLINRETNMFYMYIKKHASKVISFTAIDFWKHLQLVFKVLTG